ncbi:TonB-dependent receptor plug [Fibrella aestuarina BUZ 2]|uniref:TonB-dependent receptor plug n=1 Tax=Fibrella aestuarina BUZ 2 TaxID=1166018 RepID=I0K5X4_9BACT|nr:SusC/RagA family TonB-linked outer membrane protein [Fibrella aestuarina]CCG99527.1 TonB-dependent receptor plug [Fibrella aestuarina BUZ 2]
MKKLLMLVPLLLCLISVPLLAQDRALTGRVTSGEDGSALPGVSVSLRGTTRGTTTDAEGRYRLNVPATNPVVVFSYIGFTSQEIQVGNRTNVDVTLAPDQATLNEVVVTAFGIQRNAREVGTSVTRVNNEQIVQAAPVNIANGLTGKVAGLQVNLTNNGVGSNPRLTIRGNRSFLGNNQALLVVDGVLTDISFLQSVNPNDVANITVLKGPSAAALYGSDASNGVMVVTTKRGADKGEQAQISYTNNTQFESVSYLPGLQRTYSSNGGEGAPFITADGRRLYVPFENQQFGPAYDGSIQPLGYGVQVTNPDGSIRIDTLKVPFSSTGTDPRKAFFNTGVTSQHDLSYNVGNGESYFRLGLQRVDQSGIVPNDKYQRTNILVSGGRTVNKFSANGKVNFTYQNYDQENGDFGQSRPVYWNLLNQPAHAPLRDPRIMDINSPYGNVNGYFNAYYPNPWWQVSNENSRNRRDIYTVQGFTDVSYAAKPWLNVLYRIGGQASFTSQKAFKAAVSFSDYAKSDPWNAGNIASSVRQYNGTVYDATALTTRFTGDLLVTLSPTFGAFTTKLILGQQTRFDNYRTTSDEATQLVVPGVYNVANRLGNPNVSQYQQASRLIGVFGDLTLGFRDFLYLNITGRNDWTSLLAANNRSFFYPSVSVSAVLTEAIPALKSNNAITYLKLRGGVAQAGNVNVTPYQLQNTFNPGQTSGAFFPFGSQPGFELSNRLNSPDLKPEFTTNYEGGIEIGLFNRVNAELVYYVTNTTNQTVPIQVSRTTGYTSALVNTGAMRNQGFEVELKTLRPIVNVGGFTWNLNANYAYNKNTVTSVYQGLDRINIPTANNVTSDQYAVAGLPYPALLVTDIARVQNTDANAPYYDATGQFVGRPIVNPLTGYPILDPTLRYQGATQPLHRVGLGTSFGYKGLTLSAVAEYRGGAVIYNQLGNALEFTGAGIRTTYNNRENFVFPNSVLQNADGTFTNNTNVSTRDGNLEFWTNSGFHNAGASYVTSAAFWKLRELALSYNVPASILGFTKVVKTLNVALTGRNLLMFRPKTNVFSDPEFSLDNSNAQGTTNELQTPPTRFYGFRVSVGF